MRVADVVWVTPPPVAVTVTVNVPDGVGALIVTVAAPYFITSACDIADTVTVAGLGTVAGAVYRPVGSIVPALALPPVTPFTCHATCVFVDPLTVEENGCC